MPVKKLSDTDSAISADIINVHLSILEKQKEIVNNALISMASRGDVCVRVACNLLPEIIEMLEAKGYECGYIGDDSSKINIIYINKFMSMQNSNFHRERPPCVVM